MPEIVDALLESPLKLYLSRLQIEQLASFMDVHSAEPDEMIVEEGSPAAFIALIVRGRAVVVGQDIKMATLAQSRFFGESMFSRRTDASKIALSALVRAAPARQIALIDCQLPSAHLKSLGSRSLPRSDFLHLLRQLIDPLDGDSSQAERF